MPDNENVWIRGTEVRFSGKGKVTLSDESGNVYVRDSCGTHRVWPESPDLTLRAVEAPPVNGEVWVCKSPEGAIVTRWRLGSQWQDSDGRIKEATPMKKLWSPPLGL